jgi:hypothetical protein
VAENTPISVNRNERVLAFMVTATVGVALLAMIVLAIGALQGVDFREGVWPVIAALPLVALPIAFILVIVRLVVSTVRRSRDARDA